MVVAVLNPGTPLAELPQISVAIAVRNDLARLLPCLEALDTALSGLRTQVVVMDAGSSDRTTTTLITRFRHVTLLRTASDLGPAWSWDIALARCAGPMLLLLDPGARPDAAQLGALFDHLKLNTRCGVVAAGLSAPDGTPLPGSAPLPTLRHLLLEESGLARLFPKLPWGRRLSTLAEDAAAGTVRPCPPAGVLCLRREALDQAGPLDTNLPFAFHHLDWFRRLTGAGWEVQLLSSLRVPFVAREESLPPTPWQRHRDRIRYARKHHGVWGVRCATLSLWSFACAEALCRLVGRAEPRHCGLLGAFDALARARGTRGAA